VQPERNGLRRRAGVGDDEVQVGRREWRDSPAYRDVKKITTGGQLKVDLCYCCCCCIVVSVRLRIPWPHVRVDRHPVIYTYLERFTAN